MIFLDTNSFLIHKELNNDINVLESQKKELEKKIFMDKKMIDNLKNLDSLEVYGRKTYNLKKENETIFHIRNFDED
jgi:cell division protein DivIC